VVAGSNLKPNIRRSVKIADIQEAEVIGRRKEDVR